MGREGEIRNVCYEIIYICDEGQCSSGQTSYPNKFCGKDNKCSAICGNGICDEGDDYAWRCPEDCE